MSFQLQTSDNSIVNVSENDLQCMTTLVDLLQFAQSPIIQVLNATANTINWCIKIHSEPDMEGNVHVLFNECLKNDSVLSTLVELTYLQADSIAALYKSELFQFFVGLPNIDSARKLFGINHDVDADDICSETASDFVFLKNILC